MSKRKSASKDALEQEYEQAAAQSSAGEEAPQVVPDPAPPSGLLQRNGLHVEDVVATRSYPNKPPQEVCVGYVIVRSQDRRVAYAGRALAWSPSKTSGIPFETRDDAVAAAMAFADALERFATQPTFAVSQVAIRIPIAPVDERRTICPMKLSVPLDHQETVLLDSVRRALRAVNAEPRPGMPVDSNADAIRWLLRQVGLAAADPESSPA